MAPGADAVHQRPDTRDIVGATWIGVPLEADSIGQIMPFCDKSRSAEGFGLGKCSGQEEAEMDEGS